MAVGGGGGGIYSCGRSTLALLSLHSAASDTGNGRQWQLYGGARQNLRAAKLGDCPSFTRMDAAFDAVAGPSARRATVGAGLGSSGYPRSARGGGDRYPLPNAAMQRLIAFLPSSGGQPNHKTPSPVHSGPAVQRWRRALRPAANISATLLTLYPVLTPKQQTSSVAFCAANHYQ